jgi:Uma2 family endonuclease
MSQVIPLSAEARPKPAGKISYEEFLKWYDDVHAEWLDGEIIMGQPPTFEHQADSDFLTKLVGTYVEERDLGVVVSAPFQMRLRDQKSGREPDLLFIAKENVGRITRTYLDGPADLVVEIISPESVARDRAEKFAEYEAAGIREYWLIDPQRKQAEFYLLDDEHHYQKVFSGKEGIFHSQVITEFYLQVEWLWQRPLPKMMRILKQMGIS